jgi:hypothetical protein
MTDPSDLVRALRELSLWNQSFAVNPEMTWAKLMENAADLIESLQAQLAESQRRERAASDYAEWLRNKVINHCVACPCPIDICKGDPAEGAPECALYNLTKDGPTGAGEVGPKG